MSLLALVPKKKKAPPKKAKLPPPALYTPKLNPSQFPVPARLARKLQKLRGKFRVVQLAQRAARALCVAMMLLTAQMFIDWLFDLNVAVRALILAGDVALLVHFLRGQILPLILRPPNMEACALMVEKQWPRLKGRIIASVQLARPRVLHDSPELVSALQQEAEARTTTLDFGEIVPTGALKRYAAAALVVIALWAALFIMLRPGSVALLERVFLLPAKVPRKTEVICLSGDITIPAGQSVLLEAQARGIVPSHGLLTLTDDTGKIREITIEPERDHSDRFSLKVSSVEQSLTYTIRLNDGVSDTYRVKALPRPNILSIDCVQIYPPYTGLAAVKRDVGNLELLAGSRLKIHATANSKITKAVLKMVGLGQEHLLDIGGTDGKDLTGTIDIPTTDLTGFSIQLTGEAGIASGDETQYRIDIIPDRPPVIQLTYPDRIQELDTLKAKPTIAFIATDDYGIAKVALCYRVVQDADAAANPDAPATPVNPPAPQRVEMEIGQGHPVNMKNQYIWDLGAIQPHIAEGTTLEYWMEAEDANNVTGPGRSESEHHTIKIVSEAEKKAEIMNRLMDSLSTIGDLTNTEEKVNKDLGDVLQGKKDSK